MVLAFALLPVSFAVTRVVAGVVVAVLVMYFISRVADRWDAGVKVRLKPDATYASRAYAAGAANGPDQYVRSGPSTELRAVLSLSEDGFNRTFQRAFFALLDLTESWPAGASKRRRS